MTAAPGTSKFRNATKQTAFTLIKVNIFTVWLIKQVFLFTYYELINDLTSLEAASSVV